MAAQGQEESSRKELSFLAHLAELRQRLLRCVLCVLLLFLPLSLLSRDLYTLFALPLMERLGNEANMIATSVASPFITPLKLALFLALFLAIPYLFYQLWAFVAPGLYRREKRLVLPLLISSSLLFYLGSAFTYFLVLPVLFNFLLAMTPEGIVVMTDMNLYLGFCLKMFFAFGIAFETPLAVLLCVRTGICSADTLAEKRALIIVSAFVVGMLLTPPDIVSQFMLALPVWLLFEGGLLLARKFPAPAPDPDPDTEDAEPRIHTAD